MLSVEANCKILRRARFSTEQDNKTFRIQFRPLNFPSIFPGRLLL